MSKRSSGRRAHFTHELMPQLPWHDYAGESATALFALVGKRRADSLVVAFEAALGRKAAMVGPAKLSVPELDVLAIEALEREVNNGGYAQFFTNSSNEYAGRIVEALRRIGCETTASVTERAIALLAPGTDMTPETLGTAMEREDADRDAGLEDCDQAYQASGEDIAGALLEYLVRNHGEIQLLP